GLVGRDRFRYGGAAFGNVSARLSSMSDPARPSFVVSGSQTGGERRLERSQCAVVTDWSLAENSVVSFGECLPSSEALTHATLYEVVPEAQYVFHVHSPEIFGHAGALGLSCTDVTAGYGTPAMAQEVARLCRSGQETSAGVLVMGGHEDGVVAYGQTAEAAAGALVSLLARARSL
ncbi:MAG: class II aldolase/adducin family protein, partial [Myxococcota bacterium]